MELGTLTLPKSEWRKLAALYEIADRLLAHQAKLETALRNQEALLFPSQTTLFLYDLTNTYFEGQGKNNERAKRGKSKEKRADCPLVTLALGVDQRGFPILSRIYGGNQSEPKTLPEMLQHLYVPEEPNLFAHERPMIVMDRGIATKHNMALLQAHSYPYLVVERRAVEKDYGLEFEQAKEERFLQDLGRLAASITKGNIQLIEKVGERIGRLKERYPSIASHYEVTLHMDNEQQKVISVTHAKKESRGSLSFAQNGFRHSPRLSKTKFTIRASPDLQKACTKIFIVYLILKIPSNTNTRLWRKGCSDQIKIKNPVGARIRTIIDGKLG